MEFLFSQEYLVRILVVKRIVWLEYWLTQDSVVVVQVDTGLCGEVLDRPRNRWWECLR